jgi:Bacterial protein of unknown function (Gcw_chp)
MPEVVVEGENAVYLGTREVEPLSDLGNGAFWNEAQGGLYGVQNLEQWARASFVFSHDPPHDGAFGRRQSFHRLTSIRPAGDALKLMRPSLPKAAPAISVSAWLLSGALSVASAHALALGNDIDLGGSLAFTSDYIYRGVSASNGHAAAQADLHLSDRGSYIGVWGSTRADQLNPYAGYEVEVYLGHRFEIGGSWSSSVSARAHYFVGGMAEGSADYEELAASVKWSDRWSLSVSALPNAVHYWFDDHLGRGRAWVVESSGQWLLLPEGLFATAGAGYYYATGIGAGIAAGGGYTYGNLGLAFEHRRWRIDVGYFVAQDTARRLTSYPVPHDRLAATLAWRF